MKPEQLEVKVSITNIEEFKTMLTAAVDLINALDDAPMTDEVSVRATALKGAITSMVISALTS
jgi:hypothetical protein